MSKHDVSRNIPGMLQSNNLARNRKLISAGLMARLARGYNSIATKQRKLIICKSQDWRFLQSTSGFSSSSGFAWPFFFRTSDGVTQIDIHLALAASDLPGTSVPTVSIQVVQASAPGTLHENRFSYAPNDAGVTIGASDVVFKLLRMPNLLPNTEYTGIVRFTNGARVASMTIHETMDRYADDSVAVITNPTSFVNEGPIMRADQVDLNVAAVNLWRHNAGHLLSWTPNYSVETAYAPTIASSAFQEILGTGGPTQIINNVNRGSLQRPAAIPCRMAVRPVISGGSQSMDFRLRGPGGATFGFTATVDGFDNGTPLWPWVVANVTMPNAFGSWAMEADTGGRATTFTGWSLYQWEA
ncbi:MAG TPA: hypothetical protein VK607_10435 [Kofleriaceae bacterium]|nr:hypothetical protein [Kofleriaceae bacterium]